MRHESTSWTIVTSNLCLLTFFALTRVMVTSTDGDGTIPDNEDEPLNGTFIDYTQIAHNSSSREQMHPVPLSQPLNGSEVDAFMQETNNVSISNTSLDDITHNNETLQLRLWQRQRQRQIRLMTIQLEILQKLGWEEEFNITSKMTEEQRTVLLTSYVQLDEFQESNETDIDQY